MHTFKFPRPFAVVLAIAAPTSDVHADPGSDAVVHAAGNVPKSPVIENTIATHLTAATSPTDKTGGSTLKLDASSQCSPQGQPCFTNDDCCRGLSCYVSLGLGSGVSVPLSPLIAENGKP